MKQHETTISYAKICFIIQLKQPFANGCLGFQAAHGNLGFTLKSTPPLLEVRNGKARKRSFHLRYAAALDWQQFTLVISIISERGTRLASGDHVVYSLSDAAKHSCKPNAVCETLTEDLCLETFVWGCLV